MNAHVTVPHAGTGTHTIVVALEVDDTLLEDPAADVDVVRELSRLAADRLSEWRGRMLLAELCDTHGVDLEQLRARDRGTELTQVRQDVMAGLRRAGWTLPRIGRLLDRDHTTVLHSIRRAEARAAADGIVRERCEECEQPSMAAGRWCLKHFQAHTNVSRERKSA